MNKPLCFGKGDLKICISRFIYPSKPIGDNYMNFLKMHKIKKLVLIEDAKKTIKKNGGVSNVYMFLHADFEGVKFYADRKHEHLKKQGREEDFFVSEEE